MSLSMKAGKLKAGEFACEKALRDGTAKLVVIATDASDNTKKKFTNKAFYYKVPVVVCSDRDEISRAIGRENRVVVAVTDNDLADGLNLEVGGCLR